MASGRTTEDITNYLKLLFNNTGWANIGDATGLLPAGTAGSFYVSLHTANPGVSGNQGTSEAAYTSYARVAVARTSGGWTVGTTTATNAADIVFPAATGGSETETYIGIGTASSGAGHLLWFVQITTPLAVTTGVTPDITAGTLVLTAA